jgi:hypothetical protein
MNLVTQTSCKLVVQSIFKLFRVSSFINLRTRTIFFNYNASVIDELELELATSVRNYLLQWLSTYSQ